MALISEYTPFGRWNTEGAAQLEGRRWAIVLAGGEGERLHGLTTQRYGAHRPKQYCAFWGGRTMLQWTLDRTREIIPVDHTKIVIGNGHESMFARSVANPNARDVIVQPENCGTLPGILLPLSHVLADDPEATVLLLPSDHFILPMHVFADRARRAMELATRYPDKLVLLGAVPDSAVPDYGWVQPAENVTGEDDWDAQTVSSFVEKPGTEIAERLFRRGWLWNTMIVAAKAKLMWSAAFECAEELLQRFSTYRQSVAAVRTGRAPAEHAQIALNHLYRGMTSADFSRDLLQRLPERCTVLPLKGVYWCDCGHPERLASLLTMFSERDDVRGGFESPRVPVRPLSANTVSNPIGI